MGKEDRYTCLSDPETLSLVVRLDVRKMELAKLEEEKAQICEDMKMAAFRACARCCTAGKSVTVIGKTPVMDGDTKVLCVVRDILSGEEQCGFSFDDVVRLYGKAVMGEESSWNIFKSPEAEESLKILCGEYQAEKEKGNVHPLLLIADTLYRLFLLSPFVCGNEVLVELMVQILLLEHSYEAVRYIAKQRRVLGELIRRLYGQKDQGRKSERETVFAREILYWFEICQKETIERLEHWEKPLPRKWQYPKATKKERIEHAVMSCEEPLTKTDICLILPDVGQATVEMELGRLLKEGRITKIGNGKLSAYMRAISGAFEDTLKNDGEE